MTDLNSSRPDQRSFHRAIENVCVEGTVILGTSEVKVSNLLKIGRGAVIELDSTINTPVKLFVSNRVIAEGIIVVQNDKLALQITRVIRY